MAERINRHVDEGGHAADVLCEEQISELGYPITTIRNQKKAEDSVNNRQLSLYRPSKLERRPILDEEMK